MCSRLLSPFSLLPEDPKSLLLFQIERLHPNTPKNYPPEALSWGARVLLSVASDFPGTAPLVLVLQLHFLLQNVLRWTGNPTYFLNSSPVGFSLFPLRHLGWEGNRESSSAAYGGHAGRLLELAKAHSLATEWEAEC